MSDDLDCSASVLFIIEQETLRDDTFLHYYLITKLSSESEKKQMQK